MIAKIILFFCIGVITPYVILFLISYVAEKLYLYQRKNLYQRKKIKIKIKQYTIE